MWNAYNELAQVSDGALREKKIFETELLIMHRIVSSIYRIAIPNVINADSVRLHWNNRMNCQHEQHIRTYDSFWQKTVTYKVLSDPRIHDFHPDGASAAPDLSETLCSYELVETFCVFVRPSWECIRYKKTRWSSPYQINRTAVYEKAVIGVHREKNYSWNVQSGKTANLAV